MLHTHYNVMELISTNIRLSYPLLLKKSYKRSVNNTFNLSSTTYGGLFLIQKKRDQRRMMISFQKSHKRTFFTLLKRMLLVWMIGKEKLFESSVRLLNTSIHKVKQS